MRDYTAAATPFFNTIGLIGQLGSGGFIIRHGAIRMSQIAVLFTGAGLAVAVLGGAAGFVLSALIGNGVASVATPASSQLLGRWSVMRYAPFAFSIAQCAIPAGILLTGYLGPITAQSFGWRDTMLASAALCWAVALMLQPLRGRLDTEASPRHPIRLSDFRTTITAVLAVRELRSLSFACFAFNGTQAVFIAYFVTYVTSLGYPLVAAGSLFRPSSRWRCRAASYGPGWAASMSRHTSSWAGWPSAWLSGLG